MASLYIKDEEVNRMAEELALKRGSSKTAAVKFALSRELASARHEEPVAKKRSARDVIEQFWREHPLPPPTGMKADKAFFDDLSGDL